MALAESSSIVDDATTQIRAVDLFCGAGGLSWGLVEALEEAALAVDQPTDQVLQNNIQLVGVNHDATAIESHSVNHPWADHYNDDIGEITPREVFEDDDPEVHILSGGIECTYWSTAKGGKPKDEQKRIPAWDFLTWAQKLNPKTILVENVREFYGWDEEREGGSRTEMGDTFRAWIDSLHSLGYNVDWKALNAADYGTPQARKRLFILARKENTPEFPDPTHSKHGKGDKQEWNTAADIIDWEDRGESIWTRDLVQSGVTPPASNTLDRIGEGIRRHCDDKFEIFADVLQEMGPEDIKRLRKDPVAAAQADTAAEVLDEPFFVSYGHSQKLGLTTPPFILGQHSNSVARKATADPLPTVTTDGNIQLIEPAAKTFFLRQQSGGVPSPASDPLPTIATDGAIGKTEIQPLVKPRNGTCGGKYSNKVYDPRTRPLHTVTAKNTDGHFMTTYLCPLYNGRENQPPRTRRVDRPLMTIPASKNPAGVASPFLVDYHGNSTVQSVDGPLGALETKDRFALVVPEAYPHALDIRYRLLKIEELKRAQGFPENYTLVGTKSDKREQIGNAVPVNLAKALTKSLLESDRPALTDYLE